MSRTYRRQKGDTYWKSSRYQDDYIRTLIQWGSDEEDALRDFKRWSRTMQTDQNWSCKASLKWATNYHRRADKRMDLTKVYKATDYEDLDLYDRKRNYKKLIWIYL